jgi:serine/threonine-protein kinase HipA
MRQLVAWLNDTRVGVITDEDDVWRFEYAEAWAADPRSFDLAPGLPRARLKHLDGASNRAVQWYFDNLLPEERLRETLTKEAKLKGDDAFALLEYLGAESAGSLVLLPPGELPAAGGRLQALADDALSDRIRNIERIPLSAGAPKRMSLAGAQNKLAVVYRDGVLCEPVGNEPSTHILKPEHPSADYAASVINEYVVMRLADRVGLPVPVVHRLYTPEPVYLVQRFDRHADAQGRTQRSHIIDTCQLLNKSRAFKQSSASLDTLAAAVGACTNRIAAALRMFNWLLFNVLIGNDDNHLKNLSYSVTPEGIAMADHYDLLSTCAYHTKAIADERAVWASVPLMYPIPGCTLFADVDRKALHRAGDALGVPVPVCERMIDRMAKLLPIELDALLAEIDAENATLPKLTAAHRAQEGLVLRTIRHIVLNDMLKRVSRRAA